MYLTVLFLFCPIHLSHNRDCYPQLLESIYLCHPPTVVAVVWKLVRVFMPKRVVAKFDFINPKTNVKERNVLYRHISQEHLPEYYGGKNPIPPEQW